MDEVAPGVNVEVAAPQASENPVADEEANREESEGGSNEHEDPYIRTFRRLERSR